MKPKRAKTPAIEIVRPVDPNFVHVRSEQNLIRMGLFSAGLQKDNNQPASRTIHLTVKREGRRKDTVISFEGSRGLPTMACLDKYMALMRIAAEEKKQRGKLTNPIIFPGYRLLREADLSDSGKNYDALMEWGTRLTKTTITSSEVVYLANSRKYADETLTIFQKFKRIGQDDASGRAEEYEVWLADWLLENLNLDYVYLEEYEPYKKLNRPIAKGLYGFLHYWFTNNNDEDYFDKDYVAICELLDIRSYEHKSQIKQTLGPPLDELVRIGYLSNWELLRRLMDDKNFKIRFWPGDELLKNMHLMDPHKAAKRKHVPVLGEEERTLASEILTGQMTAEALTAFSKLKDFGIHPKEAKKLLEQNKAGMVLDMIEYVSYRASEPGNTIRSAQSLLVSKLREGASVPSDFVTTRQRRVAEAARNWADQKREYEAALELEYGHWYAHQGEQELERLFNGVALERKIEAVIAELTKTDKLFARMPMSARKDVARRALVKEVSAQVMIPSFEEWCKENAQRELFIHN